MSAIAKPNQTFDGPEYYSDTTNFGVAIDPTVSRHTDIGSSVRGSLASWEQKKILSSRNLKVDALRGIWWGFAQLRTGSTVAFCFPIIESCSSNTEIKQVSTLPSTDVQIATIRSALSLQMKELAEVVGVERPTIYSWLNAQNSPQPVNRDRLHTIYRLALQWNRLSAAPLGKYLHIPGDEGHSVFNSLKKKPIVDEKAITGRFKEIAHEAKGKPRATSRSVREIARKHNIDPGRITDREDEIDLVTGKRISDER